MTHSLDFIVRLYDFLGLKPNSLDNRKKEKMTEDAPSNYYDQVSLGSMVLETALRIVVIQSDVVDLTFARPVQKSSRVTSSEECMEWVVPPNMSITI